MQSLTSVMNTLKKATKTIIVKSHTIGSRSSDDRRGRANKTPSSLSAFDVEDAGSGGKSTSLRSLPDTYRPQLSPLDVTEFGQVTVLSYEEQDATDDAQLHWNQPTHPSPITLWRNDVEMSIRDAAEEEVPLSPAKHINLPFPSSPSVTSLTSTRAHYHATPGSSIPLPGDGGYTSYGMDACFLPASLPSNMRYRPGFENPRRGSLPHLPATSPPDSLPDLSAAPTGHPSSATEISSSSASSDSAPPYAPVNHDSIINTIKNFTSRINSNDSGLCEEAEIIANRVKALKFNKKMYEKCLDELLKGVILKGTDDIDIEMFVSTF